MKKKKIFVTVLVLLLVVLTAGCIYWLRIQRKV